LHGGNEGCVAAPPCEDRNILTWFCQLYVVARRMLLERKSCTAIN
jgi:hypothetical protein